MKIYREYFFALIEAAQKGTLPSIEQFKIFVNGGTLEFVPGPGSTPDFQILPLHEFTVPEDATIDSAKEGLPMTECCYRDLIEKNFGGKKKIGNFRGGFISMDANFESEKGIEAISILAQKTERKFRPGTALEFLLFIHQNRQYPPYCVTLGSVWNGNILLWNDWDDDREFRLDFWKGECYTSIEVFFVEDLESSATLES